ncbi:MAG: magnesium chelatase ATPase subunit D, partial [Jannaschia sp.]
MSDARWTNAVRAAQCLIADPVGLGGIHLRARAGDARDVWISLLKGTLQSAARLSPEIGDVDLFGGLDLTETLRLGRPVQRPGILERSSTLILPMAERAQPGLAARLGQVLDAGKHCLICLDEGTDADECLTAALADRLGLAIDLDGLRAGVMPIPLPLDDSDAVADPDAERRLAAVTLAFGIASLRRTGLAMRVARASAHIDGRESLSEADLTFAVEVSLAPHATRIPQAEQDPQPETPDTSPDQPDRPDDEGETPDLPKGDILLEAALATLPPDVLERLAAGVVPRASGAGAGATRKGN